MQKILKDYPIVDNGSELYAISDIVVSKEEYYDGILNKTL